MQVEIKNYKDSDFKDKNKKSSPLAYDTCYEDVPVYTIELDKDKQTADPPKDTGTTIEQYFVFNGVGWVSVEKNKDIKITFA